MIYPLWSFTDGCEHSLLWLSLYIDKNFNQKFEISIYHSIRPLVHPVGIKGTALQLCNRTQFVHVHGESSSYTKVHCTNVVRYYQNV